MIDDRHALHGLPLTQNTVPSLTIVSGGVVILAVSVALRIEELRTMVGLVVDLVRRKGRA